LEAEVVFVDFAGAFLFFELTAGVGILLAFDEF
jgi:hypothetical protein